MLEELEAVVEGLCSTEAEALADPEAMVVLQRCLTRMEAAVTRATGASDTSGAWASTGSRGAAMWLSVHAGLPTPVARRQVRLARALRQLPVAEQAWLGGDIHQAHVAVLDRACNTRTEEAMARDEEVLVGQARRMSFGVFCSVVDYWRQHADPDGCEKDAAADYAARRVDVSRSFRDIVVIDGQLEPVLGNIFVNQLKAIERELFEADWAEARARLGEGAGGPTCAAPRPSAGPTP
ncbi:MAG: hypothetical protein ACRD0N_06680 [Acidimicrobiales bacterium]